MSPSMILENALPSEIQAAMGICLLRLKNGCNSKGKKLTLDDIGSVIGRSRESISQYISDGTEMSVVCWIKATAKWPELNDMLLCELDEAEKAAAARQRAFKLEQAA